MRTPGGRGKDKKDGANQTMGKLHRTAEADTGSTDIGEEETQCEPIST